MANYDFPPTSRYYGIETTSLTGPDGTPVAYLKRRFVPPASRFALLRLHTVSEGERLDAIAARELGDPLAFWRLCDANDAMRPDALTETLGRTLRIALPEGIPAPSGSAS
ncbi:MAG TPA: LysM domain-containing protein [Ideonella sp.]|nr:LysM domain-containing protein [Ideonella sp.]